MKRVTSSRSCQLVLGLALLSACGEGLEQPDFQQEETTFETTDFAFDDTVLGDEEAALTIAQLRLGTYVRTTSQLNLRSAASATSAILAKMPGGAKVFVVSGPHNTKWYKVNYKTFSGYAHGGYLAKAPAKVITLLNTTQKIVALSFDAGADRGFAARILNVLRDENVKASFGMTGRWAEANPDLVLRMANEGHMLFNHTYSHRSFTGFSTSTAPLTYQERADELWKTHNIIMNLAGKSSKPFFRPPYADYDSGVLYDVFSRGYDYHLMWSCDSLGWKGLTAQEILDRTKTFIKPGAVFLFHVGAQSQDANALAPLIHELKARGYTFAKMSQYLP
jgi:peptidoglycan-N-acetylglucosamine deacetylase